MARSYGAFQGITAPEARAWNLANTPPDSAERITWVEDLPTPLQRGSLAGLSSLESLDDFLQLLPNEPPSVTKKVPLPALWPLRQCQPVAPPGSRASHRACRLGVVLVAENGPPYRAASWHR